MVGVGGGWSSLYPLCSILCCLSIFQAARLHRNRTELGVGSNQEIEWGLFLEKEFQGKEDQKGLMSGWLSLQAHFSGMKSGSWPFHLAGTVFV